MEQHKYKLIIASLIVAIILLISIGYSYLFLDFKTGNETKDNHASPNYQRFILKKTANLSLTLSYNDESIIAGPETIKNWFENYSREFTQTRDLRPNYSSIRSYLEELSKRTDTPPINARLGYQDGKIVEFDFPTKGLALDIDASYGQITSALSEGKTEVQLVFKETEPELTIDKIANLGITTLLGRGESNFSDSSSARIHNIKTAARIFNGALIKPGEVFSFNKLLGDVDAITGYKPELVIKSGGVVKEYGGGVCQVSTTLFRAAVFAGLPIIERRPHSFPVNHYNPQGFDATIYPGVTDLRFKNDTPGNILVQVKIVGTKISFDLYGGGTTREVTVTKPIQYDINPDGSMKAVFSRTIKQKDSNEEPKKESFYSTYKSPARFPLQHNPLE